MTDDIKGFASLTRRPTDITKNMYLDPETSSG